MDGYARLPDPVGAAVGERSDSLRYAQLHTAFSALGLKVNTAPDHPLAILISDLRFCCFLGSVSTKNMNQIRKPLL